MAREKEPKKRRAATKSHGNKVRGDAARALGERWMREADTDALDALEARLRELRVSKPTPLSVIERPNEDGEAGALSWDRVLLDPAIVELALSLGLPLRMPQGDPRTYHFSLYAWQKRGASERDALRLVGAHPFFKEVLAASFLPTRETKDQVGNWIARAVTMPEGFAHVFATLDALGERLNDTWTIGALETHKDWLQSLCQPAVFELCPKLARAVRQLDPARLLRNQLRAGIMDEWGWPLREQLLETFPKAREASVTSAFSGPLPYQVLLDVEGGRIVAFGPDGVVLDQEDAALRDMKDVRRTMVAGDDVLVCQYRDSRARWVKAQVELELDPYESFDLGADRGIILKSFTTLHAGERPKTKRDYKDRTYRIWCDRERYFAVRQESTYAADGSSRAEGDPGVTVFDPRTGKKQGRALPKWMAKVTGDGTLIAHLQATFMVPAQEGAEHSPLGAKDGVAAHALTIRDGDVWIEGIDGRKAKGLVNGLFTVALMTFPGRTGFYPVVQSAFSLGIAMPDGTTPLVPMDRISHSYWAGTPRLPLLDWLSLRPRDLAASEALARCSDEAARAIYSAAAAPPKTPEQVTDYGNMQAVLESAPIDELPPKTLLDEVVRVLPEVKHPRMQAGVAGLAQQAASIAPIVARMKSRVTTSTSAAPKSDLRNEHVPALSQLFDHERHWWIEKLGTALGQQMLDVAQFLFASDETIATPAPTVVPWPLLLVRMGEILYRVLAPGTPKHKREELIKVLELWQSTPFPDNLARLRLVQLAIPTEREEVAGLDRENPQRLIAWTDRFFVQWSSVAEGRMSMRALQYGDGTLPEGVVATDIAPVNVRFDRAYVAKVLSLFATRGAAKFSREIPERLSVATRLSKTASTLLWCAGHAPWLIGDGKMERFLIDRADVDDAERELRAIDHRSTYERAMPDDPETFYDPIAMTARLVQTFPG